MENLFKYIQTVSSNITSLIEDMSVLQEILSRKKNSPLSIEKLAVTEKEIRKKVFYLRILEQVSYLEEYKNDIKRVVSAIEDYLEKKEYSKVERKKITHFLSSLGVTYKEEVTENAVAPVDSVQKQTINKLEGTIAVIEEILLSYYGLATPIKGLEEKLVKTVEDLFNVNLADLKMEEKQHIEEFFNHVQAAFKSNSLEGWEEAFIKCTEVLNKLKVLAGIAPKTDLSISIEYNDPEKEDEEITFELEDPEDTEDE